MLVTVYAISTAVELRTVRHNKLINENQSCKYLAFISICFMMHDSFDFDLYKIDAKAFFIFSRSKI